MIINFKLYEMNEDKPEVGDYVICDGKYTLNPEYREFIDTHIGKLIRINISIKCYVIEYFYPNRGSEYTINLEDIKYWSKNRNELEIILQTNKFNI